MKNPWLIYSILTVACWGLYGIFLHKGQVGMHDPANGKYKAFLFVGVAYFLIAVLAPLGLLLKNGVGWDMPGPAIWWSLLAGVVGALGAFFVLLAFANKGTPNVVMSIIFAGAPIINAAVAIMISEGISLSSIDFRFYLGILMAAAGGCLVTFYKPKPHQPPAKMDVAIENTAEVEEPQK